MTIRREARIAHRILLVVALYGLVTAPLHAQTPTLRLNQIRGGDLGVIDLGGPLPGQRMPFRSQGYDLAFTAGAVQQLLASPASRYLAVVTENTVSSSRVTLWQFQPDQQRLWSLAIHARVTAAAFSPRGHWIAIATAGGLTELRESRSGEVLRRIKTNRSKTASIAVSPDGNHIATGGQDGMMQIWNRHTGARIHLQRNGTTGLPQAVSAITFAGNANQVIAGSADGVLRHWHPRSGRLLKYAPPSRGLAEVIHTAAKQPLLSRDRGGAIHLWDQKSRRRLMSLPGRIAAECLSISPDGSRLAVIGFPHATAPQTAKRPKSQRQAVIEIWNVAERKRHQSCPAGAATAVCWLSNTSLAYGSATNDLKTWDLSKTSASSPKPAGSPPAHAAFGNAGNTQTSIAVCMTLLDGGRQVAFGCENGDLFVRDSTNGRILKRLPGAHADAVYSMAASADGSVVVTGGFDGAVHLWGTRDWKRLDTFRRPGDWVFAVAVDRLGKYFAAAYRSGHVAVRDREAWVWAYRLNGTASRCAAFSPDGKHLIAGFDDHSLRLWDIQRRSAVRVIDEHRGAIRCIAFGPRGQLVTAGDDRLLRMWDTSRWRAQRMFKTNSAAIRSLAFWGDTILTGGQNGEIRLWDPQRRQPTFALRGHRDSVVGLATYADRSGSGAAISCSLDGTIRRWNTMIRSKRKSKPGN